MTAIRSLLVLRNMKLCLLAKNDRPRSGLASPLAGGERILPFAIGMVVVIRPLNQLDIGNDGTCSFCPWTAT
jgi:hypothetical protein